jgi:hypothetical protein
MNTASRENIQVIGLKYSGNNRETILNFEDLITYDQLKDFEDVRFNILSPVPGDIRSKLRANMRSNTESLNTPRIFATVKIQRLKQENLNRYIDPDIRRNASEYLQIFEPYLQNDKVYNDGVLKNIVLLNEFKKVYSSKSFECNRKYGTHILNRNSTNKSQITEKNFKRAELLETNWSKPNYKHLLERKPEGEPEVGKEVLFLHTTAASNLWNKVEKKLKDIGIHCIILDADNLTLAYKIYGKKNKYYPMWKKEELNENGEVNISGDKLSKLSQEDELGPELRAELGLPPMEEVSENNIRRLKTCTNTQGPSMFKFIIPDVQVPSYNWDSIEAQCTTQNGGKRGKTRSRKVNKRKTRRSKK